VIARCNSAIAARVAIANQLRAPADHRPGASGLFGDIDSPISPTSPRLFAAPPG